MNAGKLARKGRLNIDIEIGHHSGEFNVIRVDFSRQYGVGYEFIHNGKSIKIRDAGRLEGMQIPFIPAVIWHGKELGQVYNDNIQSAPEKRKTIVENLRTLVDDLEDVEISAQTKDIPLLLSREDQDASILLAMDGEGII